MRILLAHPNFPSQLRSIAAVLGSNPNHDVRFLTMAENGDLPGVKKILYKPKREPAKETHHYIRPFEQAILQGQGAYEAMLQEKNNGYIPDLIFGHAGWGGTLFMKDLFPRTPMALNFEWYYKSHGTDCDFDPSDPVTADDEARIRIKNACLLSEYASCDAGLCPTRFQYEQWPEHLRHKMIISHEGIDTNFFKPDPEAKLIIPQPTPDNPDNKLDLSGCNEIVTYATRGMEPYRGFPQFIEAAHLLIKQRPNVRIVIAGDDRVAYGKSAPEGTTYKKMMLEKFPLPEDRVHFVGSLPYGEYVKLIKCTHAHVYLTRPFVLSWSMLEAMSCEGLVIASDTAPVQEVITNGINGLLVDFFRPDQLAQTISNVLDRPNDFAQMRKKARETVVAKYDLTSCLQQRLAWLSGLLAANR
jgi:glycosyltransferase involved in cell wall biosynthesis